MKNAPQRWFALGCWLMGLGVLSGAFGIHVFKPRLSPYAMAIYEKAVLFHLLQSIGLLIVALGGALAMLPERAAARSCRLLFFGILLFSGSLYLLALSGVRELGMITPLGGLSFLAGWFSLALTIQRSKP